MAALSWTSGELPSAKVGDLFVSHPETRKALLQLWTPENKELLQSFEVTSEKFRMWGSLPLMARLTPILSVAKQETKAKVASSAISHPAATTVATNIAVRKILPEAKVVDQQSLAIVWLWLNGVTTSQPSPEEFYIYDSDNEDFIEVNIQKSLPPGFDSLEFLTALNLFGLFKVTDNYMWDCLYLRFKQYMEDARVSGEQEIKYTHDQIEEFMQVMESVKKIAPESVGNRIVKQIIKAVARNKWSSEDELRLVQEEEEREKYQEEYERAIQEGVLINPLV